MKKFFLFQFTLLLGTYVFAQTPNYDWGVSIGGTKADRAKSVVVDNSGNVYTTGYFSDKTDFDPDASATYYLNSNGAKDIFICKVNKDGKFQWAVNMGGSDDDEGHSIQLDASGDVYVTGFFQSKFDFDPGKGTATVSSNGSTDIFVCKFDASGNFQWVSTMGGTTEDGGNGITLDANGNVITTGYFSETTDFDPGIAKGQVYNLTSYGQTDIFVSILNGKGGFIYAGQMGGIEFDRGNAITVDSVGYILATGAYSDKANFNPDPKATAVILTSIGDIDAFVVRLDAKGNYSWAVPMGEANSDEGLGITADASGNSYSTGYFYDSPDFDPRLPDKKNKYVYNLTSNGDADIYVWKLDNTGLMVWADNMGGADFDAGTSVDIDNNRNVYTTGVFSDKADFDPGSGSNTIVSNGAWDIFLSKLDASGNHDSAYSMGESDYEGGESIFIDKSRNIFMCGAFMSTNLDLNFGAGSSYFSSTGDEDIFILKLNGSNCKTTSSDNVVKACNSYTYNGNTYYKSGVFSSTLKNAGGCDSIVTLKLTLNTTVFATLDTGVCNSLTINGETFLKEGIFQQTLISKGGCDSFLNVNVIFKESKGSFKTKACNTSTINGKTYTTSGTYTQKLTNKAGCDSTLTIDLTILKSTSSTIKAEACETYKLFGTTYTKSGIYMVTDKNNAGCDSNVTLNLTINNSTSSTLNINECLSYKLNNQTYTKSGTYLQTIPNKKGCDSLITLNLSINHSESSVTTKACQSYTMNGKTYTDDGTYTQVIPNSKGCDSTITLNLTLTKFPVTVQKVGKVLTADASGVGITYQWVDCNKANQPILGEIGQTFSPLSTGDYAVKITKNECTDMSACTNVIVGSIGKTNTNAIVVYPNPTKGNTTLIFSNSINNASIKIFSSTGQMVFEENQVSGNEFAINLSPFTNGIYMVEVNQNGIISRSKVVKQ